MATMRPTAPQFDSFGTLGSLGTWCGTGACAGTLGSLVADPATANVVSGGTLGSFATFSGNIAGQGGTCWGTMFGS
jgi:hypothetical protein